MAKLEKAEAKLDKAEGLQMEINERTKVINWIFTEC